MGGVCVFYYCVDENLAKLDVCELSLSLISLVLLECCSIVAGREKDTKLNNN